MYDYAAKVRAVHDGDTITVDCDTGFDIWRKGLKLRLIGINAPELVKGEPFGLAARDYLRLLIPPGSNIWIRTHKDATEKYGRYLAEVYLTPEAMTVASTQLTGSINDLMITAGHAIPYWP